MRSLAAFVVRRRHTVPSWPVSVPGEDEDDAALRRSVTALSILLPSSLSVIRSQNFTRRFSSLHGGTAGSISRSAAPRGNPLSGARSMLLPLLSAPPRSCFSVVRARQARRHDRPWGS